MRKRVTELLSKQEWGVISYVPGYYWMSLPRAEFIRKIERYLCGFVMKIKGNKTEKDDVAGGQELYTGGVE